MAFWPFPEDIDRAKAAADSWCAEYVQAGIQQFPETAEQVKADFAYYANLKGWEIRRGLRGAATRLRRRAAAARMSRGFFFENVLSMPAELPEGTARLSLNQLSVLVKRDAREHHPENVKKRSWRPSRNIIHLATAFDQLVDAGVANDNGYHIADAKMTARILELAELHEQIVLKDRRFGVSADDLIRVRLA